jgi:hypothetical protein
LFISPAETNNENIANDAAKHASLLGVNLQPEYEKNENVVFHNQVPGSSISASNIMDETFMDGNTTDTDLASFLQRPVKIKEITWAEGNSLNISFNPWALFFNNTAIKRKLENFAYLRCKLKIHVQINASPFYHGRALVSYRPLPTWGPSDSTWGSGEQNNVLYSQRPSFWINPSNSQGGDMELPFFYFRNWLKIFNGTDFTNMGQMRITSPTVLKNANSVAGSDVEIVVWAMASDVVLSGATSELALQSTPQKISAASRVSRNRNSGGKMRSKIIKTRNDGDTNTSVVSILNDINGGFKDEYGKGVVSSTASAIASAANTVSSVPVIGPFATATATAASGIAEVADYFGWTNVPNIADSQPVQNQPFHAFASPSISTPVQKLSVDPKNELCVDSRTVGLDGTDELSIESLVTRESYLISTNFAESASVGDVLFCTYVWPLHMRVTSETINSRTYTKQFETPLSHISRMFRFWRGDISFRFVANKTKYHSGRVLITWDPLKGSPTGNVPTETHSAIWDFSQSEEFVFTVPWGSADPWLRSYGIRPEDPEYLKTDGTTLTSTFGANGQIVMTVLTRLTGPATGANIDLLVFSRGCPNIKFNDPIQVDKRFWSWRPQSSVESLDTNQIEVETTVSAISLITMGEDHISLRPLLHRTNEYIKQQFDSDTTSLLKYANHILPRMPLLPGFDTAGFHTTNITGVPRFNYIPHTAYTWLSPMFVGMRGSVTYHVNAASPEMVDTISIARSHKTLATTGYSRQDNVLPGTSDAFFNLHFLDNDVDSGMAGMAVTNQKTQAGLSVNIPMYLRFRMIPTNPVGTGSSEVETNTDSFRLFVRLNPAGSGKNSNLSYTTLYYTMGPDFNLFYFLNVPLLYGGDLPPTDA